MLDEPFTVYNRVRASLDTVKLGILWSSSNRRDASERAQLTKLDLFRSCSDVAAAADLEADIPPGLDEDAVES
jgi:hypothetical protein